MPLSHSTVVTTDPAGSVAARFWAKVDVTGDCWAWTAARNKRGYGVFNTGPVTRAAHVVAWEMAHGPAPDGYEVDHACHNRDLQCQGGSECRHRRCVNPGHLEVVTHQENCRRGERGRLKDVCRKGLHPMEGANLMVLSRGTRECRACKRQRQRDRQLVQSYAMKRQEK